MSVYAVNEKIIETFMFVLPCRKKNQINVCKVIRTQKLKKIQNFTKNSNFWTKISVLTTRRKTLNAFFSLSIDFEAYSLKFFIFAWWWATLIFVLFTFRQNEKKSFFSFLCLCRSTQIFYFFQFCLKVNRKKASVSHHLTKIKNVKE